MREALSAKERKALIEKKYPHNTFTDAVMSLETGYAYFCKANTNRDKAGTKGINTSIALAEYYAVEVWANVLAPFGESVSRGTRIDIIEYMLKLVVSIGLDGRDETASRMSKTTAYYTYLFDLEPRDIPFFVENNS